jgi:hypothetical protein
MAMKICKACGRPFSPKGRCVYCDRPDCPAPPTAPAAGPVQPELKQLGPKRRRVNPVFEALRNCEPLVEPQVYSFEITEYIDDSEQSGDHITEAIHSAKKPANTYAQESARADIARIWPNGIPEGLTSVRVITRRLNFLLQQEHRRTGCTGDYHKRDTISRVLGRRK